MTGKYVGGKIDLSTEQVQTLKANLFYRALLGTGLTTLIGALAQTWRNQDGTPVFQIHGAGPVNRQHLYQLKESGYQPYSIQVGNNYYPYEWTPLYFDLAMLGNYADGGRYTGNPDGEKAITHMMSRMPAALSDRSFLRGIMDLAQQIHQASECDVPKQLEAYLSNHAANFVPVLGMSGFKQAYQDYLDDKLYQASGFGALGRDLPFPAHPFGLTAPAQCPWRRDQEAT